MSAVILQSLFDCTSSVFKLTDFRINVWLARVAVWVLRNKPAPNLLTFSFRLGTGDGGPKRQCLDAFHRPCLCNILGIWWFHHSTNNKVYRRTGSPIPIATVIRRGRLWLSGHVARFCEAGPICQHSSITQRLALLPRLPQTVLDDPGCSKKTPGRPHCPCLGLSHLQTVGSNSQSSCQAILLCGTQGQYFTGIIHTGLNSYHRFTCYMGVASGVVCCWSTNSLDAAFGYNFCRFTEFSKVNVTVLGLHHVCHVGTFQELLWDLLNIFT